MEYVSTDMDMEYVSTDMDMEYVSTDMDMEYVITDITEEALDGAQYGATINGQYRSGFRAENKGENGRIYAAIQEAIAEGAEVEPFVPYVPTPLDLLAKTDAELIRLAARTMEDIFQERIDDGGFVAQPVKDKIAERVALREQL